MEPDAQRRKIEETVLEILKNADLETTTEYNVRTTAARRLCVDLSDLDHKLLVRRVVESFLLSTTSTSEDGDKVREETNEVVVQEEQQPQEEQTRSTSVGDSKEGLNNNARVICKLKKVGSLGYLVGTHQCYS
ncbi:unnamed protein product [Ilex paraguariensis]|uniref:DEK-C domain-containing protein n=1 Tax=Ilex paraguariensis TaxID=185542 RepID=A0ABC8QZ32_9AQUA